jgi:hypothetical protein
MVKILIVLVIYSILKDVPKLISVFKLDYKDYMDKKIKKYKLLKERISNKSTIKEENKNTVVRVVAVIIVMTKISILLTLIFKTNG